MSMAIVHHVWQKSQTRGSARTLLLSLAIHANDCCGVAWVSDTTLRHEVNVSRQRIHELKNAVEATGELTIVERPGSTNLYFVSWQGHPLGAQGDNCDGPRRQHQPGCPCRGRVSEDSDTRREQSTDVAPREPCKGRVLEDSDTPRPEGVSEAPDPQVSECSNGGYQKVLIQKTKDYEREKQWRRRRLVSLSPQDGASAPEQPYIAPEVARKFGLRYGIEEWPPRRRER
jgi:hypothetical protein